MDLKSVNGQLVKDTIVYVNGEYCYKSEAKISIYDSGFQHGDGVYEGIRVYDDKIFMLEEHVKRLYESCKTLDIHINKTFEELIEIVKETIRRNLDIGREDLHIRLQITRGIKGLTGMNPNMNLTNCSIVICVDEKKPIFNKKGIKLITSTLKRFSPNFIDPKIHTTNQLNQIMAVIEANRQGADEAIMLDVNGFVSETNSTTLLMIKDNQLIIPSTDYILVGITRKIISDTAKSIDMKVIERNISVSEFYNADEVFVCGTVGEIVPVVEIDGKLIAQGFPGNFTKKFSEKYRQLTHKLGVHVSSIYDKE